MDIEVPEVDIEPRLVDIETPEVDIEPHLVDIEFPQPSSKLKVPFLLPNYSSPHLFFTQSY